jgi:hypothetical protein
MFPTSPRYPILTDTEWLYNTRFVYNCSAHIPERAGEPGIDQSLMDFGLWMACDMIALTTCIYQIRSIYGYEWWYTNFCIAIISNTWSTLPINGPPIKAVNCIYYIIMIVTIINGTFLWDCTYLYSYYKLQYIIKQLRTSKRVLITNVTC